MKQKRCMKKTRKQKRQESKEASEGSVWTRLGFKDILLLDTLLGAVCIMYLMAVGLVHNFYRFLKNISSTAKIQNNMDI